jgi:hypothetical protein
MQWRAYGRQPYAPGLRPPLVVEPEVRLVDSTFIAPGAATSTTQRLTGLTGTFAAGRISDDTNPLPSIDIGNDGNTEVEFCVRIADSVSNGTQFRFRITVNGTALDTYTVTPVVTVGTPAAPPEGLRATPLAPDQDIEEWRQPEIEFAPQWRGTVSGTLASSLGAATLSAAGAVNNRGTLSAALGGAQMSASGFVGNESVFGPFSSSLQNLVASFSGAVTNRGVLSGATSGATMSASGLVNNRGTLSVQVVSASLSASGLVNNRGTLSSQVSSTMSSSGLVTVTGNLSMQLGDATMAASGFVAQNVSGTFSAQVRDASMLAFGNAGGAEVQSSSWVIQWRRRRQ